MKAARCAAGSDCSTAVTANRTSWIRIAWSSADGAVQPFGAGSSQGTSNAGINGAPTSMPGSRTSWGSGRRLTSRSRSIHTFRAIRRHQVVNEARAGSYRSRARQARSNTSCAASSASNGEPSI